MMKTSMKVLPLLVLSAMSGSAFAAGFQLANQNGAGTATSYAGEAAAAEDASTIYFNPAGMTYLSEGHNVSVGGTAIVRSVKFSDTGTTSLTRSPGNIVMAAIGGNGGDGGGVKLVPFGFWSYSLSKDLRIGVGVSPTFGNETEYNENFAGRFSGRYTSIHQININPSIAYRLNEKVSLGFGVNYASNEVEFWQSVPVGVNAERKATLKGDDHAWGWNAGAIFQVTPATRIGLSYRSKIKFKLEGTQEIQGVSNTPVRAQLETPDNFSLALHHRLNDRWEVLADATWTGWSSIPQLLAVNANTGATAALLNYNFKDAWRVGLGAKYQLNNAWNLRAGIAFDKSPVPDDASRTMTVPDSDRTWLSFGARWKLDQKSSLDLGYAHIFFKDSSTARAVTIPLGGSVVASQTVRGDFKTSADLFSVQYNVSF